MNVSYSCVNEFLLILLHRVKKITKEFLFVVKLSKKSDLGRKISI